MTGAEAVAAPRRWMRGLSLGARVMVGLTVIAIVATVSAFAVTLTTQHYLMNQLDERLLSFSGLKTHSTGADLPSYPAPPVNEATMIIPDADDATYERPSDVLKGYLPLEGDFWVSFRPNVWNDEVESADPILNRADLDENAPVYITVDSTGDEQYRVLATPAVDGWEITALSLEGVQATSDRLVTIEAVSIVTLLAGLAVVGWWVISLGVTPMRRMVDASARIADGDLDVRLEGGASGTESAALATSLNTMIGTLTTALSERERSEARLREFVADASHELRTPLTTVLGYAQLFRKGALSRKADATDAWGRTEAEATRMKRLVEDMLELARYDAEPEMHIASTDLVRVVGEVLSDAGRAHPEVAFSLADRAPIKPEGAGAVMAHVDGDRLRQAVINVVTNAAQHGAENVTVTVARAAAGTTKEVRIDVSDDGPGMSPEVAARATERFVRGDGSRSRNTGGAGLGLAITAAIVEAHRGRLEIASVEGEGTRIGIVLPG